MGRNPSKREYKKARKIFPLVKVYYESEREKLEILEEVLKDMEQILRMQSQDKKEIAKVASLFIKCKNPDSHLFLVDRGNEDFWSTLLNLKKIASKTKRMDENAQLFFLSETENLLDMVREILRRPRPDLWAMAVYQTTIGFQGLAELSYEAKLEAINKEKLLLEEGAN